MKKLGIMFAATLIAACSTSVDGTGKSDGTSGGGLLGGGNGTTNETKQGPALGNDATANSGGTGGTCSLSTGDKTCDACANGKCCTEIKACDDDAACSGLWSCASKCGDDTACGDDCVQQFPNGRDGVKKLLACGNQNCATECQ